MTSRSHWRLAVMCCEKPLSTKSPGSTSAFGHLAPTLSDRDTETYIDLINCVFTLYSTLWIYIPNKGTCVTCILIKCGSAATKRTLKESHSSSKKAQPAGWFCENIKTPWPSNLSPKDLWGHLHVFVPHVVVVLKDWLGALFILRKLWTIKSLTTWLKWKTNNPRIKQVKHNVWCSVHLLLA